MWARAQMRGGALVQGTGAQNSGEGVQAQRAEKGGIGGGDTGAGARGEGRRCSAQKPGTSLQRAGVEGMGGGRGNGRRRRG